LALPTVQGMGLVLASPCKGLALNKSEFPWPQAMPLCLAALLV